MNRLFKIGTSILALGTIVACDSGEVSSPWTDRSKQIIVCLASEPDSIDPALNSTVDGSTMLVHLETGLTRFANDGEGGYKIENDLAETVKKETTQVIDHVYNEDTEEWDEVIHEQGIRYTIKLRDDIYWSNHNYEEVAKITSDDFIYSWNRASGSSLAADYAYMFEGICDGVAHETDDKAFPSLGLKKIDDKTFTIDLPVEVPYFEQLFAFPVYFPVYKPAVEKYSGRGEWAAEANRYISCGAYVIKNWTHDMKIVLEKNPHYWNKDNVKCEKITFALSEDDAAQYASFKAGDYDLIDTVPQEQIDAIQKRMSEQYHCEPLLGNYYVSFNMNSHIFDEAGGKTLTEQEKAKVRLALAKLLDRKYIVENVAKAQQTPLNAFVDEGITDWDGEKFASRNGPDGQGGGWYRKGNTPEEMQQNIQEAVTALKEVGYPYDESTKKFSGLKFKYLYNTGTGHELIAKYIHDTYANYGIEVVLANQEWNTFLNTRKNGDFDMARNGWNADYDDAYTYLSMWVTQSGNNDVQFGRDAHASVSIYSADIDRDGTKEENLTWAQSYDKLIDLSNKEANPEKRSKIMHEAEDLLMSTGAVCPLYNYTDIYLLSNEISGLYTMALGYKFFHDCVHTKK